MVAQQQQVKKGSNNPTKSKPNSGQGNKPMEKDRKSPPFVNSPGKLGNTKQWTDKTYYWCPANHKHSHWHTHKVEEYNTYKKMTKEQNKSNNDDQKKVTVDEDKLEKGMEAVPGDMPQPRGESVLTHCFVDSDHVGNTVIRRSQTSLLLFVNRAPIVWYSKRQNTVETSTFGSEFIAMKTAVEQIEALRYKLRMFGVPLEGPTNIFCDNKSVFKNASIPDSTLKKSIQVSVTTDRGKQWQQGQYGLQKRAQPPI